METIAYICIQFKNKHIMTTSNKTILSILLIAIYIFSVYHVFVGLLEATAVQGFGGILLIIMGGVLIVRLIMDIIDY